MIARVALLALALCACGDAATTGPRDTILLASVHAFEPAPTVGADGYVTTVGDMGALVDRVIRGRVERLLDDIAAATDVLGPADFELVTGDSASPRSLARTLHHRRDVRAVILLHGDLSVMRGIDPSLPPHEVAEVRQRRIDHEDRRRGLELLETAARRTDVHLMIATAPLGRQARVEVPELAQVADDLRSRGDVLDLGAHFETLEPAQLFENGIDRPDDYGHDELARALYDVFVQDPGPLPPRDEAERAARREARALHAYLHDEHEVFLERAAEVLAESPLGPRHATRHAAMRTVIDSLEATVDAWEAIDAPPDLAVPGLAAGRSMALLEPEERPQHDAFERDLMGVVARVNALEPDAVDAAWSLVDGWPHRLEAWIVLQFASMASGRPRNHRDEAIRHLRLFPRSAVTEKLSARVLAAWPETVEHVPLLLLAQRPYTAMHPTNPYFQDARRRAWLGFNEVAVEMLDVQADGFRVPPSWRALRAELAAD